jgi:hypothetical protein
VKDACAATNAVHVALSPATATDIALAAAW